MKMIRKALTALIIASVCLNVHAARSTRPKPAHPIDYSKALKIDSFITEERRDDFLKFMVLRSSLLVKLDDSHCPYQTGGVVCVIDVPVYLLTDPKDASKQYCVAVFPEVVTLPGTAAPGNSEKTIVWSLTPKFPVPSNATFTFFAKKKDLGIIVFDDKGAQMHDGALGDGTNPPHTPPDATKYLFRHKNNKAAALSVYLPIVVRTDDGGKSTEKVSLCGTPDPRIAND